MKRAIKPISFLCLFGLLGVYAVGLLLLYVGFAFLAALNVEIANRLFGWSWFFIILSYPILWAIAICQRLWRIGIDKVKVGNVWQQGWYLATLVLLLTGSLSVVAVWTTYWLIAEMLAAASLLLASGAGFGWLLNRIPSVSRLTGTRLTKFNVLFMAVLVGLFFLGRPLLAQISCHIADDVYAHEWPPREGMGYATLRKSTILGYEAAVFLDPNCAEAHSAIAHDNTVLGETFAACADYQRGNYAEAIDDVSAALKLDPSWTDGYEMRGWSRFYLGDFANSAEDFKHHITVVDSHFAYSVIMSTLAYRKISNTAAANHMLDLCNQLDVKDWPYPALQYLRGELSANQMFQQADNNDKLTEARTYAGIESAILGQRQAAVDDLKWVRDKGNRNFDEYQIALSELKRLMPVIYQFAWPGSGDNSSVLESSGGVTKFQKANYTQAKEHFSREFSCGVTEYQKGHYTQAIEHFSRAAKFDTSSSTAYKMRGWSRFCLGDFANSAEDFKRHITGVDAGEHYTYNMIMSTLAYRKVNNTAGANDMLDMEYHDGKDWPGPALQYLRGKITANQMFEQAGNNYKMTEAKTYAGIESVILGKRQAAIDDLKWVRDKGNRTSFDYQIALSELKRLGGK